MLTCPACGGYIGPDANGEFTCGACGTSGKLNRLITSEPVAYLRKSCPECREQTLLPADNNVICKSCGHILARPLNPGLS